mmetsp:Transcript_512/g.528  ORF Transcript_512/g.528 Transcript_512/m.528 type:complete len:92 (+) Transcript_512:235-510(+)
MDAAALNAPALPQKKKQYSIMFVSDFTVPKYGGVETHCYQLAQCLIDRGHKVCFLTNYFNYERTGVRIYANGLKVYYLPFLPWLAGHVTFF